MPAKIAIGYQRFLCTIPHSHDCLTAVHLTARADLGIDVHKSHGYSEEHTAAALQEEDVPHAQAALQGQAVHKNAEEPVGADAGHIHAMPLQVSA